MKIRPKNIPKILKRYINWVLWIYGKRGKNGKRPKIPIDAKTHLYADPTDPTTWSSFKTAYREYKNGGYDGIGYVLTISTGIVCIDFDNCVDPESGTIDPIILKYLKSFNSYCEYSPSGKGIHCFIKGVLPGQSGIWGSHEVYADKRFITITGRLVRNV